MMNGKMNFALFAMRIFNTFLVVITLTVPTGPNLNGGKKMKPIFIIN